VLFVVILILYDTKHDRQFVVCLSTLLIATQRLVLNLLGCSI